MGLDHAWAIEHPAPHCRECVLRRRRVCSGPRAKVMLQQGRSGARTVEDAVRHIDRTIAAVQVGITAAGIALGWVGEPALARLIEPALTLLPATWQGVVMHILAFSITFLFLTFISIIVSDHDPRWLLCLAGQETPCGNHEGAGAPCRAASQLCVR